MEVPQAIINEAQDLIARYGSHLRHLGKYEKQDVFVFEFPNDVSIGFPVVYLWNGKEPLELCGPESLDVIEQAQ